MSTETPKNDTTPEQPAEPEWEGWAIWIRGYNSDLSQALEAFLKEHGFQETDWCELYAPDGGHASFGPVEAPPPRIEGEAS